MYVCNMKTILLPVFEISSGNETQTHGRTARQPDMMMNICMYIALRRFLHIEAMLRQKQARSRNYALLLFRMTSRVLYSAC